MAAISAILWPQRRQEAISSLPHRAFQPLAQMFKAEPQAWLLHHSPYHRHAAGRKALFKTVASGHEIIDLHTALGGMANRQRVRKIARPFARIGIVEPALIGVYPPPAPKVIKIADNPFTGPGLDQLNPALVKTALDQPSVKALEKWPAERMRSAAALP
jgi:hypothetical protein